VSLEDRSFAGPSAVGRYWIAHAEGFVVQSPAGRVLGIVRSVALDPTTAETLLVVERSSLVRSRSRVLSGQRVGTVFPWSRRLVLARASRPARRLPARVRRSGRRALAGGRRSVATGRRGLVAGRRGLAAAAVGTRRAAVWTRPRAAVVLALAWQLVRLAALVAFVVALRVVRGLAAFAGWLAIITPSAARATRAWLVRKRDEWPWRDWLRAPVRLTRAGARRVRTSPLARARRPVLSGAWARRSRSGA
jgi:hypothetical protein